MFQQDGFQAIVVLECNVLYDSNHVYYTNISHGLYMYFQDRKYTSTCAQAGDEFHVFPRDLIHMYDCTYILEIKVA